MKSKFSVFLMGLLFTGLFAACSNDEKADPNPEIETGEVSFNMTINDILETRAQQGCLTQDSLKKLANAGLLKATVTVLKSTKTTPEDIKINIRYVNSSFMADPIELPRGENKITAFTVHHLNNDLYFSAVAEGAKYSAWVEKTLPQIVKIDDSNIYKKTTVDIYVLCAFSENAEDFGYIKWNIHFVQIYCLPFSVNVCDETGEDVVGTGTLIAEKGKFANGVFTVSDTLSKTQFPPATAGSLSDLCFPYDSQTDAANTYLRYTIAMPGYPAYTSVVNVATLLTYKDQPEWSQEFNYLHLWFCNCQTWFFPNDCNMACIDNFTVDATTAISIDQISENFMYLNKANQTWTNGLNGIQLDPENHWINMETDFTFILNREVKFHKVEGSDNTQLSFTLYASKTNQTQPILTVSLYDAVTKELAGKAVISGIGSSSLVTSVYTLNSSDFNLTDGSCYYIFMETPTNRNVYLQKMSVTRQISN